MWEGCIFLIIFNHTFIHYLRDLVIITKLNNLFLQNVQLINLELDIHHDRNSNN